MKTLNTLCKIVTVVSLAAVLFLGACINTAQAAPIENHPVVTYTNMIIKNAKVMMEDVADSEFLNEHKDALVKEVVVLEAQLTHFIHHDGDVEFGEKTVVESAVFNFSKLVEAVEINEFDETCNNIIDYANMSAYTCMEL